MTIGQNKTRRKTLAFFIGPRWANKKEKASLKTRLTKFFYDIGIKKTVSRLSQCKFILFLKKDLITRNLLSD